MKAIRLSPLLFTLLPILFLVQGPIACAPSPSTEAAQEQTKEQPETTEKRTEQIQTEPSKEPTQDASTPETTHDELLPDPTVEATAEPIVDDPVREQPVQEQPAEQSTAKAKCVTSTFTLQQKQRAYILCTPDPLPAGPLPLVLGFHGGGGAANSWKNGNPWHELAAQEGFIMVYMQGCKDNLTNCAAVKGSYSWNVGKSSDPRTTDDQQYTLEVVKRLTQEHKLSIDTNKRYGTGHSLGGMFLYSMYCDRPNWFRAIGPVSATPSDKTCTPHANTSIFHLHGEDDTNVPFTTGCCSRVQKNANNAAYLPGCKQLPLCTNPNNYWSPVRSGVHPFETVIGLDKMATMGLQCKSTLTQTLKTTDVTCQAFDNCAQGKHVEFCMAKGVGHALRDFYQVIDMRTHLWARFSQ